MRDKNISVVKDEESPTGFSIISGSWSGIPATIFEVRLWNMYVEATETIRHLRSKLEELEREKITWNHG